MGFEARGFDAAQVGGTYLNGWVRCPGLRPAVVLLGQFPFRQGPQTGRVRWGEPLFEVDDQGEHGRKAEEDPPDDRADVVPLRQHDATAGPPCAMGAVSPRAVNTTARSLR